MYVRNVLKPSDFVTFVPVGLNVTLQYNDRGIIEKIYRGSKDDRLDITHDILPVVQGADKKPFPFKIPIKGGTTWVSGVIYTNQTFKSSGKLPGCIHDEMVKSYQSDSDKFNFFAGNVHSLAAVFRGAAHIRKWLSMSSFDVLPGSLVPNNLNRDTFEDLVKRSGYQFKTCRIASYIVFRGNDCLTIDTNITQYVVNSVHVFTDEYGNIKAKLSLQDEKTLSPVADYSDIVKHNIQTGSLVLFDSYMNILFSECIDGKKRDKRGSKYICPDCGLAFNLPDTGLTTCPNSECTSRLYPRVTKLTKVLNLPQLSYETYRKYVNQKQIISLLDIFDLDQYKALTINTTLSDVLNALVPVSVVPNSDLFTLIANKCTNNVDTLMYYIQNPNKILSKLGVVNRDSQRLVKWLSVPNNSTDVCDLLNMPNVMIKLNDKRFDGPPIMRMQRIFITGKFIHGSAGDIIAILQSYAAQVVTELDNQVNCVVIGDVGEDINSSAVRIARTNGVKVFTECQFFDMYKIDEDMQSNLV